MVKEYAEETLLSDTWRDRNPNVKMFTFKAKIRNKVIASRIDYCLMDIILANWCEQIKIIPGFRSDHSGIYVQINPHNVKRGHGMWRINNSILEEVEFVTMMNKEIDKAIEEAKNLHLNEADTWEVVKLAIILRVQDYSKIRAKKSKEQIQKLQQKIEQLEQENRESDNQEICEVKKEYEQIIQERVRGAMLRSGCM